MAWDKIFPAPSLQLRVAEFTHWRPRSGQVYPQQLIMSSEEQSFQITVSEEALSLLKRKLDDTRFPDEINDAEWDYCKMAT